MDADIASSNPSLFLELDDLLGKRCLAHDGPSLIEIRTDPEAITPRTTLTALRNAKR